MGSFLKQDVDQLEMVQRQAAVSSRGTTGLETRLKVCMLLELNLPPLQECRKQQLTTFYKVVEGHITALPLENSLMAADRNHRRIHPTTSKGCSCDNTITRYKICNTHGFKIPGSNTEQYKSSFIVRTVANWNKLEDTVVTADSVAAFSSAVGRVLQGAVSHTYTARSKIFLASSLYINKLHYISLLLKFKVYFALCSSCSVLYSVQL